MNYQKVSEIFRNIAKILEIKADNPFRIRAYERAAANIEALGEELDERVEKDTLTSIPGIGKDLAEKIKEIYSTGKLKYYEEIKRTLPVGLLEMINIPGVGPKTVQYLYTKLGIKTISQLKKAAKAGKLRSLEGIKEKTEENILKGISLLEKGGKRTLFYFASSIAQQFITALAEMKEVEKIEVAGSVRRKKDTVKDIDILISSRNPDKVMDKFTTLTFVERVLAKGKTKSSVIAKERNIQVDLRIVDKKCFGSALLYFTGSKNFNISLRKIAVGKKFKINEYGIFSMEGGREKWLGGRTEEEVFKIMGMPYIPAELREDRGEIEAALDGKLPVLITKKDIKGDLHTHSKYSDGSSSVEEIVKKATNLGYEYIAITDHSQSLKVAGGLDEKEVFKKIEEIKKLNSQYKNITILCGTEVDIDKEGNLDYPCSILKEFDIVVAAIHTGFKQSQSTLTRRLVSACKNKYVHIIAHPTGRLWQVRDGYSIDFEELFKAAYDYQTALEINSYPQRMDLSDNHILKAKERKVKFAINTDAHILEQLNFMSLGVGIARRGWLSKDEVINCWEKDKLLQWLRR